MIKLNGAILDFKTFPNGETRVDGGQILHALRDSGWNHIGFKYENDSDLIKLMFLKRFLDNTEARNTKIILDIAYMPYSRMDRVEGESVFTLKYVSEFINSLKFDEVDIFEPHSDVTCALVDKSIAHYPTIELLRQVVHKVGFNKDVDYLFFPDAGAQKRYSKVEGYKQIVGYKDRDFATGRIKSLDVVGLKGDLSESKVVIIDDLCSYGGTFDLSATKLKELGAQEIYLIVAHCEKVVRQGKLLHPDHPITKIFTTNSIIDDNVFEDGFSPKLDVYKGFL